MRPDGTTASSSFMVDNSTVITALTKNRHPAYAPMRRRQAGNSAAPPLVPFPMARDHLPQHGGAGGWSAHHPFVGMHVRVQPVPSHISVVPALPSGPAIPATTATVEAFCQPTHCPNPSFLARCLTHPNHFYILASTGVTGESAGLDPTDEIFDPRLPD